MATTINLLVSQAELNALQLAADAHDLSVKQFICASAYAEAMRVLKVHDEQ